MLGLPQLTARELIRFPKSQGFVEDRQTGRHLTLWHEARQVAVTIPGHTGIDIGRGLAVCILKDAGFSVEDCLRLRRRWPRMTLRCLRVTPLSSAVRGTQPHLLLETVMPVKFTLTVDTSSSLACPR